MRRLQKSLPAAVLAAVIVFLAVWLGWFPALKLSLQDGIYQRPGRADPAIKLVSIDEKTLKAMGQFETWTREPYAHLIETLNQDGNAPAVIGLDVLMVNEKGAEDALLAEVCQAYPNVVLASNLVFEAKIEGAAGEYRADPQHIELVEMPIDVLKPYVQTGFVNTALDVRDDHVRTALLTIGENESFALAVARAAAPELCLPAEQSRMEIDYVGGPGSFETLSMIDVLEGRIPAAAFRDSIVLVGIGAAGMGDTYLVPSGSGMQMYGVEIHANILQGLLEQRHLQTVDRGWNAVLCAVIAFALVLLVSVLPLWGGGIVSVLAVAGQFLLALWLDGRGVVIDLIGIPLAAVLAVLWAVVSKYLYEALQKRKIVRAFQKYVAPQVVEQIAKDQNYQLKLGGEKRHIAVLFVDIRGFTPLCESLEPEQTVELLNEFLRLVTSAVFRHGGTLDKFIGDAAMALFNTPFDTEDYVFHALCAAQDIAAGSDALAETFRQQYGKTVSYGIGIHCGEAVVGNIGSDFRMEYTAIGDTVNTAARLEALAAPGQTLFSEAVLEAVRGRVDAAPVGEIALKGKQKHVMVYEMK